MGKQLNRKNQKPKETSSEGSESILLQEKEKSMEEMLSFSKKTWWKKHWYFFLLLSFLFIGLAIFVDIYYIDIIKKDVYLELGTKNITIKNFLKRNILEKSSILTDVSQIDKTKLGEYLIEIKVGNRKKTKKSTLHIVDTTEPKVTFQDVYGYLDYEFNPNDFIVSMEDLTELKVESGKTPRTRDFGDYPVEIIVSDTSGNQTVGHPVLHIGALKTEYRLELGTKLKKEDLLYNKEDINSIPDEIIQKINQSDVGKYEVEATIDNQTFHSIVTVEDTLAPELKLKNISIYNDNTNINVNQFIISIQDASKYEVKMISEVPYGTIGKHDIKIQAIDIYGNQVEKTAVLTIQKDTKAPKISGLSTITINKNAAINYLSDVKAVDEKDGTVEVKVNSNSVNRAVAGTYYATYTASDKAGNKATAKRKIIVNHDQSDVNRKVNDVTSSIGSSIADVYEYVKNHIRYNSSWGDDDPIWYALTNWKGNCYVQASLVKRLLEEKGYEAKLIWVTDKTHYWVLVNTGNGVWRHVDTAYSMLLATDEERYANLKNRDWDRNNWPVAN